MSAAKQTAKTPIVLFWRLRKASAPALIASDIRRISGEPVSLAITHWMSQYAAAREAAETPNTRASAVVIESMDKFP